MSTDRDTPLLPLVLHEVPAALRRALGQEGIPARVYRPGPAQGRFLLFDSRRSPTLRVGPGQVTIDVAALRELHREDPFEALEDLRADRFQWHIGGLALHEEIARVDKRILRRTILDGLRDLVEKHGGVWLRVGAFPFPYRSAFNFRIDYDDYEPRDFESTLSACTGFEEATSHFVCPSGFAGAEDALRRLDGLDVGSHGFWHHTYRTAEENLHNLRRGIEALAEAGLQARGFVAPHGRFNLGLLAAMEALGIPFSSEFALAYDELPFTPAGARVLQIPIHPVCLGLFLDAVARRCPGGGRRAVELGETAADAAIAYFRDLVQTRYRTGEPALLYGHPTGRVGRYPRVLRAVFDAAAGYSGMWKTSLAEIHRWWKVRSNVQLTVARRGDDYDVTAVHKPAGYRVAVELWRGAHVAVLPLDRAKVRVSPAALAFEKRTAPSGVRPVRIDRPEGLRSRLRRLLDWERVTPVGEIPTTPVRNWAKRTLRQLWKDG